MIEAEAWAVYRCGMTKKFVDSERRSDPRIAPGDRGVLFYDGVRVEVQDVARGGFRVAPRDGLRFVPGWFYEFDLLLRPARKRHFRGGPLVARCMWTRAGESGFRLADPTRAIDIEGLS